MKLPNLKYKMMGRTLEGTIFEIVFVVLAIALWCYIAWLIGHAPSVIPTHFDAAGRADDWGSPVSTVFPCLMITVCGACMLLAAYFPGSISLPVKVENPMQIALAMRMARIVSLVMLLITLAIALSMLTSFGAKGWIIGGPMGILIAVVIVFTILIYRAR